INMAGMSRVPVPGFIHDIFRKYFFVKRASGQQAQLDYKRYSWTVSNEKITRELGFKPRWSSAETLMAYMGKNEETDIKTLSKFDDYGMDKKYISNWWRLIFKYMHRYYWRIEVKGVENVPRSGKAVLVGIHRGLMPFDGIMHMYIILRETGRNIRFLIHPALVKNPIPISFPKLGCMIANRENADYVLKQDKLLGLYPEGIRGAFKYYQDVYSFGKFGRDEYVKSALRNQAPIIPFITLGSAEIFPIIAKFQWLWWQRLMLWPCFPIAPPFPILPVPLPTKWHTRFLEPFHVENEYPPEAASDPEIVKKIGNQIKNRMYEVLLEMRLRRKSIFWGSIFNNTI
ncbi:MAG: hypothetical protein GY781_04785, partial [Gammaproteobacteria bacterium]|nr:hypothetical protein [Gammaproteobacteria bacterium]